MQGSAEQRLLDALLEACKARGLLKARGAAAHRLDPCPGSVRVLSRLERVAETLRATLNALATRSARLAAGARPARVVRPLRAAH